MIVKFVKNIINGLKDEEVKNVFLAGAFVDLFHIMFVSGSIVGALPLDDLPEIIICGLTPALVLMISALITTVMHVWGASMFIIPYLLEALSAAGIVLVYAGIVDALICIGYVVIFALGAALLKLLAAVIATY